MSRRIAVTAAVVVLLAACTAAPLPDGEATTAEPTPSPTPTPLVAQTRLPDDGTTVLGSEGSAERAAAMSAAVYDHAPVVVVAPVGDTAAQVRAASIAVALGAPLLLDDPQEPGTPATQEELDRLEVVTVLTVGDVEVETDAELVAAPSDDDVLTTLLDRELSEAEVTQGEEVVHVAALARDEPALLALAAEPDGEVAETSAQVPGATARPSEADGDPREGDGEQPADGGSDDRPGTASPAPEPTEEAPGEEAPGDEAPTASLPATELADPLDDGVVLTTGDAKDLAALATARAAGLDVLTVPADPRQDSASVQALAAAGTDTVIALGPQFGEADELAWKVETAATGVELPGGGQVLFPGRRMVALYGTPGTAALGLLGEQGLPESIARAQGLAAEYQALTGDVVVPAFEMIVTIASAGPGADGNYSEELPVDRFVPWIEAARDAGVYVVLDLQPGRTDFLTQAQQYEALLRYPNVGLALDPEWRLEPDQVHLRQIGSVHVDEVNAVAQWLADLTRENRLPQKLLVLHQFKLSMIEGREHVVTSHPELSVLIHADGQGSQPAKTGTWNALHAGAPDGVRWGWKNFLDEDVPMLTPPQTYQVQPVPDFVSYQ